MKFLHRSVFFLLVTVLHIHGFWIFLPDKGTDRSSNANIKTPVVLVPGTAGSQLQAKLNKPSVKYFWCSKTTSDFFTLWLKKSSLFPGALNCWADNMSADFFARGPSSRDDRHPDPFGEIQDGVDLDQPQKREFFRLRKIMIAFS